MLSDPEQGSLPELWQKPAFSELLEALQNLRVEPPIWNLKISRAEILKKQQEVTAHQRREVLSLLSAIIKSSLAWLENDDQREEIWEEASKRLSERCGRTAMGEIIRRWPFESDEYSPFSLTIREPPLTGDSLGLKTWGSSYVLAQLLHRFGAGPLSHLITASNTKAEPLLEVIELGSGTGLLGLAAACVWRASVILTDLPEIMPNLIHNAELNRSLVEERGGRVDAAALTWGGDEETVDPRFRQGNRRKLVIVADPLYDDDHPALLASAIDEQLGLDSDARVLVMVPQRDETTKGLLVKLKGELSRQSNPFVCIQEDIVSGQDDWEERDDDESRRVGFWWGIYGRGMPV